MLMTPELTLIDFYISKNATIRPGVSHAIKHQKVHSISYEVFWQKEREGGRKKEREREIVATKGNRFALKYAALHIDYFELKALKKRAELFFLPKD